MAKDISQLVWPTVVGGGSFGAGGFGRNIYPPVEVDEQGDALILTRLLYTVTALVCLALLGTGLVYGADRREVESVDKLMATERYEEALVQWTRMLESEPQNAELLLRAGLAESMLERFDRAEKLFLEAQRYAPDDPKIALNLALLAQRRGRMDEARRILLLLAAKKPWYPNVFLSLGRIEELRGNYKKAMDYYVREINNSSHGEAWSNYLQLKRKLEGPGRKAPKFLLPLLSVLGVVLAFVLVLISLKNPENAERFEV